MKKRLMILTIICFGLLLVGCGNKKEASEISCKYGQTEDGLSVVVKMVFKRDNKKKLVTSGQLIMSYNLSDLTFGEVDGEELGKDDIGGLIETMFSSVCNNIGENYSDCNVVETENGADIIMDFDLNNLSQTSGGEFHKNMTIEQIRQYIIGRNEETDMICTTK